MSRWMEMCVNGCDAPISPPSKVICRECMDKISAKLEAWASGVRPGKIQLFLQLCYVAYGEQRIEELEEMLAILGAPPEVKP